MIQAWTLCVDFVRERFHLLRPTVKPERGGDCQQRASRKVVTMASVFDVANWLLHFGGEMTAWKLQKLVYYGQAWSLVWDERPLFPEPIQAWANGPVCPDLYQRHRGQFMVHNIDGGNWQNIDADGAETLKAVLDYYGKRSAQELSDLTHMERPWAETRGGLPPGANCTREISHALMAEYYESLPPGT